MTTSVTKILEGLPIAEPFRDCLYRYSRGVDRARCGHARVRLWPDANRQAPGFQGNVETVHAGPFRSCEQWTRHAHDRNVLITIGAPARTVESTSWLPFVSPWRAARSM